MLLFPLVTLLVLLFLLAADIAMLLLAYGALTVPVPFVPVPRPIVNALVENLSLKAGDVFYDLGSGDGRIVRAVAAAFPSARVVGFEKAPFPYLLSRFMLRRAKLPNARIERKDFFRIPLSEATHIYCYLYPGIVDTLEKKLRAELKSGTEVVSCDFPFTERTAARTIPVRNGKNVYQLYVYDF